VRLAVGGAHNVENALGVAAAATRLGLSFAEIAAGLEAFRGVKRRQEVRGVASGVTVIDDFAHHPTAVDRTLAAIQGSYPGARLLVAFEPRSNTSRRNLHQEEYGRSFGSAAAAWLLRPAPTDRVPEAERLDVDRLAADITRRGVPAVASASVEEIVAGIAKQARSGDVVVGMSNGAFGGIWTKLLEAVG
jgi:UDP-N-acetylmuramate: L-alanyl-gamma-D-glutamyl-meso-diaminopimelate ligase